MFFFCRESPTFLVYHEEIQLAKKNLREIYNFDNPFSKRAFEDHFNEIQLEVNNIEDASIVKNYLEVFTQYRRNLIIGVLLHVT